MVENIIEKTCECIGLYYYEGPEKKCMDPEKDKCDISNYEIRLYGTKECLSDCKDDRIWSLDYKFCYINETYCPENTKKTIR